MRGMRCLCRGMPSGKVPREVRVVLIEAQDYPLGMMPVAGDPWLEKYIFPNSIIPSMKQIVIALEGLFTVENVQNFGFYYDATLTAWFRNFHNNWDKIKEKYDERFYRMWKYYLLS